MNTSFCHLLISFLLFRITVLNTPSHGEKRGPEGFTDFGKALRASYLFSVLV